jgi:hypothetical protein
MNSAHENKAPDSCPRFQLARHDLTNFTFAFTVLTTIAAGFIAAIWGAIFPNIQLSFAGFLISLLGTALYAWSLSAQPS